MIVPKNNTRKKYIRDLMDRNPATRNQIATISGLSNPYIKELERDNINSVGRDKLLSLSIALDLRLAEIDELLTVFDRSKLNVNDIPLFLNVAQMCQFSSALHPINDSYTFDLMLLSAEAKQGPHTIVSASPASCFRHEGHRLYSEKTLVNAHPIYGELVTTINRERRQLFLMNLNNHIVENFICEHCLEEYIQNCDEDEEKSWRIKHIRNIINIINGFDNFNFYLTRKCPGFIFALKSGLAASNNPDKLIFSGFSPHSKATKESRSLTGFATQSKAVILNIKNELDLIRTSINPEYLNREKLVDFLEQLIQFKK